MTAPRDNAPSHAAGPAHRRLRIAVLIRRFDASGGGAERYATALVAHLATRHEFHVFAQRFGAGVSTDLPASVVLHRVPFDGLRPRWINQLWFGVWTWWSTRRGFDLVHAHENTWHGQVQTVHVRTVWVGLFAGRARLQRLHRWLNVVTGPRLWFYLALESARLRPAADRLVIAVSQPLRAELEDNFPRLRGRVEMLAPGVDAARLRPSGDPAQRRHERRQARSRWPLAEDGTTLLFVANDFEKKGLAALFSAMARMRPGVELLVVGGGDADVAAWTRRAEALGAAGRVVFAGTLADPDAAYRAADILVHPTYEDTFGMVVLEAMAHGLPVVVSGADHCGIVADLVDGVDALVLPRPGDPDAIDAAVGRLLVDPALRARLAAAGLALARQRDWDRVAQRQDELYRQLAR
ncbi:MAG TPA: glycosyltransferase family 4 protein [Burkholderiaceae bacterium]|nr:glycosyltransferase family 4 protein [Burkholderiaceae bacterium]